jgi:hypothetical protein
VEATAVDAQRIRLTLTGASYEAIERDGHTFDPQL